MRALFGLALGAAAAAAQGQTYTLTEIPRPLGQIVEAFDLNDAGLVVGRVAPPGSFGGQPFVWSPAGLVQLPAPPGASTVFARAIDDAGRIYGTARIPLGRTLQTQPLLWLDGRLVTVPTLYRGGSQTLLPSPGAAFVVTNTRPYDDPTPGWKSQFGWVDEPDFTGTSGDRPVPVVFDLARGAITLVAGFGGSYDTFLNDVNDRGQAVGVAGGGGYNQGLAVRWDPVQGAVALGNGGRRASVATAINRDGLIVGHVEKTDDGDINTDRRDRPFVWQDGILTELPIVAGFEQGRATDVNDDGVVVGSLGRSSNPFQTDGAWIYQDGQVRHLNALLPPGSGWSATDALRINNRGQILFSQHTGPGFHDDRWAVLTPTATQP